MVKTKKKTHYVCTECGSDFSQWQGQCTDCGAWNTLKAFTPTVEAKTTGNSLSLDWINKSSQAPIRLDHITAEEVARLQTKDPEFDRVLGGGLVPGSVILIGGHPGAGKSTLLLQTINQLSKQQKCLYITGEESLQQIALRAKRLAISQSDLLLVSETSMERILALIQEHKPDIVVVDSIQVLHLEALNTTPGSVSQVKSCAATLTRLAKETMVTVIMVGHVTKEGDIAGPKVLEHMIDCSLFLEPTQNSRYRVLRSYKNRFGTVNEVGVFAMQPNGLKAVKNPSAIFIADHEQETMGTVITAIWEGTRSLLIEVQALIDDNTSPIPKRLALGIDSNRLNMLLAILNKNIGVSVSQQDVFVNLVGGLKSFDTSIDLALIFALVSSAKSTVIPRDWLVLGEVGLTGEVRPVANGQERIIEASKQGFKQVFIPSGNMKGLQKPDNLKIVSLKTIKDCMKFF